MERCTNITSNQKYRLYLHYNNEEEADRLFCRHHFDHSVSVARLTYLLLLEEGQPFISREIAYAAGLLHDIGRWKEYQDGTDHAKISSELAGPILKEAGYSLSEQQLIKQAIAQHRNKKTENVHRSPLSKALNKADRLSRICFECEARDECYKLNEQPHQRRLIL